MTEGYASLDAHAYVDNSLSPEGRGAFEVAMRRDGKLRARVEAWEGQNEAIRLAFGAGARPRQAPPLGRPSNENTGAGPSAALTNVARSVVKPRPLGGHALAPPFVRTTRPRSGRRTAVIVGLALLAGAVAFAGGPGDPRPALLRHADAALRAASAVSDGRLDFVSDDPRAVAGWVGARFARVDARRLSPSGWSLLGVRIVAGLDSAAAMVLFEDAIGERAGLIVTPADGRPDRAPIADRTADETIFAGATRGFAYAVVGPTRSDVDALLPVDAGFP